MNISYLNLKSQALILCLYVTDNTVYVTYIWYKIILIPLLYVEMNKKGQGLKIIARPTIVITYYRFISVQQWLFYGLLQNT